VGKNSTVETFQIDRNGVYKIHILEGDYMWSYGVEEAGDTFEIVKMKKKRLLDMTVRERTPPDEKLELAAKIGESLSVLKGGKVIDFRRADNKKKSDIEVDYKVGNKTYLIHGYYNAKIGDLLIHKVQESGQKSRSEL
jgi:hypothetical protein